jgi:hypothetical protein
LQRLGWHVAPPPAGVLGETGFVASRDADGITLRLVGRTAARPATIDVDAVRELHALIRADPAARGVVACPAGLGGEAGAEAAARELAVWDAAALAAMERAAR